MSRRGPVDWCTECQRLGVHRYGQIRVVLPIGGLDIGLDQRLALTLADVRIIFPAVAHYLPTQGHPVQRAYDICDMLRNYCEVRGSHEHLFLLLYFDHVVKNLRSDVTLSTALLPLPNARFFLTDDPKGMTVDFLFWTGRRFVGVFISAGGFEKIGSAEDRLLNLWGSNVFRLMANELETQGLAGQTGLKIVHALQPEEEIIRAFRGYGI